ncbi:MAG: 6,7-dimethyl-8-ribityllumazine synthase [Chlamydiales bacterium]|jgi:6,7-dimethyl-8-ribityllumazine synthase
MLDSARQEFLDVGWAADDFEVLWVPGAFELPLAAQRMARRQNVAAVLCFGLILRGETTHDQTIAQATAQGLVQVSLETDKPVLFGVLTCQTVEQARARALATGAGTHDKGGEVARAALAMLACLETASNESSQ